MGWSGFQWREKYRKDDFFMWTVSSCSSGDSSRWFRCRLWKLHNGKQELCNRVEQCPGKLQRLGRPESLHGPSTVVCIVHSADLRKYVQVDLFCFFTVQQKNKTLFRDRFCWWWRWWWLQSLQGRSWSGIDWGIDFPRKIDVPDNSSNRASGRSIVRWHKTKNKHPNRRPVQHSWICFVLLTKLLKIINTKKQTIKCTGDPGVWRMTCHSLEHSDMTKIIFLLVSNIYILFEDITSTTKEMLHVAVVAAKDAVEHKGNPECHWTAHKRVAERPNLLFFVLKKRGENIR